MKVMALARRGGMLPVEGAKNVQVSLRLMVLEGTVEFDITLRSPQMEAIHENFLKIKK